MKSLLLTLVLLHLNIIEIAGNNPNRKCCESGHGIKIKNSKFTCAKLVNPRLQTNFEEEKFLARNVNGSCVDVLSEKKLAIFEVNPDFGVEKIEEIGNSFFPKCCVLGYNYNSTTHSCENKDRNVLGLLKKNSFIRVGLPECDIISDSFFNFTDVEMNGTVLNILGENRIFKDRYCVDATEDDKLVVRVCESDIQICSKIMCIHKCCPDGKSFINRSSCEDTLTHGVDLMFSKAFLAPNDPFVIIHGFKPRIHMLSLDSYAFQVDRFGVFSAYKNKTESYDHYDVTNNSYCVEHTFVERNHSVTINEYKMFGRIQTPKLAIKFVVTRWIKVISCFLLILTILVYILLPKMRNLFGKILLNYCVSTFIFFTCLTISQFYSNDFADGFCLGIGFLSVLSSIWSFTWLNIMCIDIWRSFGTPRTVSGPLQKKEWKTLLIYSLYGWGFPLLWISMITVFSVTTIMPEALRPVIGKTKCYLENLDTRPGNYSYIIYVTLPLLLQQVVNTVFFIKTIVYCLKIKREIERMNDSERRSAFNASKERLGLIVKLAVIMGVLFIFETVSSIYNFQQNNFTSFVEVIWDSINCMQGIFIFIIFICKKKVYDNICDRVPIFKPRKISVSSYATTQVSMQNINDIKKGNN